MNRQIKLFLRVISKWDPILRMLGLACLVVISVVAADQIYIDDQIARLKESSSLENDSYHNDQVKVQSSSFRTHFNVIKENKNESNNRITDNIKLMNVSNSDSVINDKENSINDINYENTYTPTNKTITKDESPFESYRNIISLLLFNEKAKHNHDNSLLNTTENSNIAYDSNQKIKAPFLNAQSSQRRIFKTISATVNKTEVPWEIQFTTDRSDRLAWRAYFYDQAIAVMLQDQQDYVYNCTLIEVIKLHEQRRALERLGKLMPLVPVPMPTMVHLITLCGSLDINVQKVQQQHQQDVPIWWMSANLLRGLLPGTLWCGMGDAAENYHQLGYLSDLDNCCRAHDHCPIKLRPLMNRYGLVNLAVNTKSHCSCDLEFFRCLKAVGSEISKKVGEVYFNYLQVQCIDDRPVNNSEYMNFAPVTSSYSSISSPNTDTTRPTDNPPRLTCVVKDVDGGCRKWIHNPKSFNKKLVIKTPDLVF